MLLLWVRTTAYPTAITTLPRVTGTLFPLAPQVEFLGRLEVFRQLPDETLRKLAPCFTQMVGAGWGCSWARVPTAGLLLRLGGGPRGG